MIICQRTDNGYWTVTGQRPEPIPPAGWELLLRIIRAFLGTLSPDPPPPPSPPPVALMAKSRPSASSQPPYSAAAVSAACNVAGNPALDLLIPVVIDVAASLLARCRSDQDACAAMASAGPAQRSRLVAQTRRQLREQGKQCSLDDARRAVDAACEAASRAKPQERIAFLNGAYVAKGVK